ncbi:MAG: hypothetical protein ABFD96_21020 [Armatimonadia bacterium]
MSDIITRMRELGNLFWRSARESGEAAADAIEQRTAIQRLALQIRKLDKERSALIRTIGAKVYGLHGQGKVRNQDVLVDCVRIDAILADISVLQKQIERIRLASLEKGIEVPILSDEAPLTDEEGVAAPAAVKPAGTVGQQTVPEGEIPKASEGRVEYDETGATLTECVEGPSQAGKSSETCEMPEEDAPSEAPA